MQSGSCVIHVIVADDHPPGCGGIRSLLRAIPDVFVLAEVGNGTELLELLGAVRTDVVITDIAMPGMDGLETLRAIRDRHPKVRAIVLSMHDEPEIVQRAISSGAAAYLRKDASSLELASALHSVMTTGSYISAGVLKLLMEPAEPALHVALTERQVQVLTMLAQGQSSKEIGFALNLSPRTVDVHRTRIMERLGLRDLPGLTVYAVRNGLVKT
jgi:DNA-binding NarL/FixJ family response regulator